MESLAPPGSAISMASPAAEFPPPSITAGNREKNPKGEESGVVDEEDCLSFLIRKSMSIDGVSPD